MENTLEIKNISYNIMTKSILEDISFNYSGNGIIGLLGPNGSGKTSFMRILAGLITKNEGEIRLNGIDIAKNSKDVPKDIGYLPQEFSIYRNLTGMDFLKYISSKKGINREEEKKEINKVVEMFGLSGVINQAFHKYSGGYRRRLGLAQAFLGNPKLVIIDEPTVGLDPDSRIEFRGYLSRIKEDSIILISTHIVEDIEYYSDKILILNEGKLIYDNSYENLMASIEDEIYESEIEESNLSKLEEKMVILNKKYLGGNRILLTYYLNGNLEEDLLDNTKKVEPRLENAYAYLQKK